MLIFSFSNQHISEGKCCTIHTCIFTLCNYMYIHRSDLIVISTKRYIVLHPENSLQKYRTIYQDFKKERRKKFKRFWCRWSGSFWRSLIWDGILRGFRPRSCSHTPENVPFLRTVSRECDKFKLVILSVIFCTIRYNLGLLP